MHSSTRRGSRDVIAGPVVTGWATEIGRPAVIDLVIDGILVSRTPSARFREDLKGTVSEHGYCAFNIQIPAKYCSGTEHNVQLKFTGTEELLELGEFSFSYKHKPQPPMFVAFPNQENRETALKCLRLLKPKDAKGKELVRVGGANDGGYVMLNHGLDNAICYSLGINDDVAWDMEMAERGCHIYQYDHTIQFLPESHSNFHWQKVGIAGEPSPDGLLCPIPQLIQENGHTGTRNLILKCDIEGYEWEAFDAMPVPILSQFSQIVMEIHGFETIENSTYMDRIFRVLDKLNSTHQLIHVHGNNCGWYMLAGGVGLPTTFEVTYIRKADHSFQTCFKDFPTSMDYPCSDLMADFHLGRLGLIDMDRPNF